LATLLLILLPLIRPIKSAIFFGSIVKSSAKVEVSLIRRISSPIIRFETSLGSPQSSVASSNKREISLAEVRIEAS